MKESFEPQKINPARSSFLEEHLELEEQGEVDAPSIYNGADRTRSVFREKNTGEEFFMIHKHPELQRLVSYVVKGTINTSDVVKQGENYFSHKQKLENVPSGEDSYLEEIKADTFILKYIFGDYDHVYYQPGDSLRTSFLKKKDISENTLRATDTEHRNTVVNQERKNAYYFDFEQAGDPGIEPGEGMYSLQLGNRLNTEEFKQLLHEKLYERDNPRLPQLLSQTKTLEILKDKISALMRDVFSPEQFPQFQAMVERSGTTFDERGFIFYEFKTADHSERTREIFDDLAERCRLMNEVVHEEMGRIDTQSA